MEIDQEKVSAVLSLTVAIVVLVANFFQWWDITWDGTMRTKLWVKTLFIICILLLLVSLLLLL